jgi:hypothetical protein
MADINIKSNNQSGGITAQHVNTGGVRFGVTTEKESRIKRFFWWVFGFAGLIAAFFTVYKVFFS